MKIKELLSKGESERIEFKARIENKKWLHQSICALANDLSDSKEDGFLLIGVEDDASITGVDNIEDAYSKATNFPRDGSILPPPTVSVTKETVEGKNVVVLKVKPSDSLPVRYDGKVFVRVGKSTRVATLEEERRLGEKQVARSRPFDSRRVEGSKIGDLNIDFFKTTYLPSLISPEVLEENKRTIENQLFACRFLDSDQKTPTNAGVIVCGKDPQYWLPGAYIQFVRFSGTDLTSQVKDQKEISGTLFGQAKDIIEVVKLNITTPMVFGEDAKHREIPDYPLQALRELILNALIHRNYEGTTAPVRVFWFSDRVEISNPGGLYGEVTPENFERTVAYRNPTLAEAMKTLGFIEKFGVGIQRAKRALKDNSNPEPKFIFEPTTSLVTVWSNQ